MAEANSVSDTQALLQSMLQRLRLQTKTESNSTSTHTQEQVQYSSPSIEHNGRTPENPPETPPVCRFGLSVDSKQQGKSSPGLTGVTASLSKQSTKGIDVQDSGISSTPKPIPPSWVYTNNCTVSGGNSDVSPRADNGETPKQVRKQKFFQRKMSDDSASLSSLQSVESLLPPSPTPGWRVSDIQGQGVVRKWGDPGKKRWTQKVKEKWKERRKSIERQEQSKVADSMLSPIPVQTVPIENNTTTAFDEEVGVQHQPINAGSVEDVPSPLDHTSETLLSLGSFNLMEEIFTGQEWAKLIPPSTSSQSQSSSITLDQVMEPTSNISQARRNEQTILSQWDYNDSTATDSNLRMAQSQMNSESLQQDMDTTEHMFNQRTSDFSMSPTLEFRKSQYELSDSGSNHLESMDPSVSPSENNRPTKKQSQQLHLYSYNQSNTTALSVDQSLSSLNQSQASGINHTQPGSVHEVLPLSDLSYLKSEDGSSLKTHASLSRKRSHSTERRGSSEPGRSEIGEMHDNASSQNPAQSVSPASSTSSLQYSISQDSESSASTETVVKKRRLENTRRVRFAEEVIFVPPLVLSDDDDDVNDEDYGGEGNEANADCREEPLPRSSVPRWIEALRNKTKRKPKLPRLSSSHLKFRTKKYHFG